MTFCKKSIFFLGVLSCRTEEEWESGKVGLGLVARKGGNVRITSASVAFLTFSSYDALSETSCYRTSCCSWECGGERDKVRKGFFSFRASYRTDRSLVHGCDMNRLDVHKPYAVCVEGKRARRQSSLARSSICIRISTARKSVVLENSKLLPGRP